MPSPTLKSLCLAGLLTAAVFLLLGPGSPESSSQLTPPPRRTAAADFALADSHGKPVHLRDFKGKVLLLDFWATWCGPCKVEIPWFVGFAERYAASGFGVAGVSMDDDGWKVVRPYLEQNKIPYPVMIGDDPLAAKYGGIESLPETFLIDRRGRIAAHHSGLTSKAVFEKEIEQLIAEKP